MNGRITLARAAGALLIACICSSAALAETVIVTRWKTDSSGRIHIYDATGGKKTKQVPPALGETGTAAEMTATGLWRMETSSGPIYFQLNAIATFKSQETATRCPRATVDGDRNASASGLDAADCHR